MDGLAHAVDLYSKLERDFGSELGLHYPKFSGPVVTALTGRYADLAAEVLESFLSCFATHAGSAAPAELPVAQGGLPDAPEALAGTQRIQIRVNGLMP